MSDRLISTGPRSEAIVEAEAKLGFSPPHSEFNRASTLVLHVTPETADMQKAVAHSQYAIPALEATKQAVEVTKQAAEATSQAAKMHAIPAQEKTKRAKQHTWRIGVVGFCFALACFIGYEEPKALWPLMTGIGVFGGLVAIPEAIKNARKPEE